MIVTSTDRILALLGLGLLLLSCTSGPPPPARGTPGWYWQAADETFAAGDVAKASEHLESLAKPGNEYADRAMPWRMVITGGMATGYMKVADGFQAGARANQIQATAFRRQMNEFRTQAERQALQFAQVVMGFQKAGSEGAVPLAFPFPKGSSLPVAEITKSAEGIMLSESEVATAERRSIEREIQRMACLVVGAEDDVAKAQGVFGAENATVGRNTFVMGAAVKLNELAGYFGPRKIDRPDRVKQLNEIALELVKGLPESDDSKALIENIEKAIQTAQKGG